MKKRPLQSNYQPHKRVQLTCNDPSLAKQHLKDECDIDFILKKHRETGMLTHINTGKPNYGDFMTSSDYHEAMNAMHKANESFATLPSEIRAKFANNPADFIAFAQDPQNAQEMIDMGLSNERPATVADEFAAVLADDRKKRENLPENNSNPV